MKKSRFRKPLVERPEPIPEVIQLQPPLRTIDLCDSSRHPLSAGAEVGPLGTAGTVTQPSPFWG